MPEIIFLKYFGIQDNGVNIGGNSGGGILRKSGRNIGRIYNSQGKVHTGYYQNWKDLSKEYCKTVISARKQKGCKPIQTDSKKKVS